MIKMVLKNKKINFSLFLIGIVILFTSCSAIINNTESNNDSVDLANPASKFCIENNGKLDIRVNKIGEYGVCIFEDNSECEEWDYLQGNCNIGDNPNGLIFDFESCTKAGYPILESYPEKCIANGITYTREPSSTQEICIFNGGNWLELHKECEFINKTTCDKMSGTFFECESACRNNPDTQICTKQCVPVCKLNLIINDFDSCVKAGNPTTRNIPAHCIHNNQTFVQELDTKEMCNLFNGKWLSDYNECEGISQDQCKATNGTFYECESACRNDPNAEFCTLQCVQVCKY